MQKHGSLKCKGQSRGRPRKTWRRFIEEDMAKLNLSVMVTHDREIWRNGILGSHLTRDGVWKNDANR